MALPIGSVLDGKFRVVQILGEGGMGTVYKVEQLGSPPGTTPYYYAVKELLINPHTSEEERKVAIERFNKEIALLRGLKHPRIAALMLPFQDRGNYYFAMEFVPGRTLEKILEDTKGPLPEEQVIRWMIQVCEALTYIHTRTPPIILRDLKPGNIMVTHDDDVQLIDFGIARRFDPNKRTNTENLGTISYASPEHLGSITAPGQRRSAKNPGKLVQTDARSDIYSLGATMYHLLTNYEPDPIQTPVAGSIVAKNPRLRTVQVVGRTVCPIEQVIIKAMQQDSAQRFQSAEAMRVALQQCLPNQAAPVTVQIPALSPNATIIVPTNGLHAVQMLPQQGIICPKCGFQNRLGAKFCKRDGQPLIQGAATVPPPRPILARPAQTVPPPAPIRARPVQPTPASAVRVRPSQPIRARPVGSRTTTNATVSAYQAGLQSLSAGKPSEAITHFKRAQSQGNASYELFYNLGRAYRQCGLSVRDSDKTLYGEHMKLAAEHFEGAVKLKNNAVESLFQLGMCFRDLGLAANAASVFKKALALSPNDPAICYQLGLIALDLHNYREAETYLRDGLKINPKHVLILLALGKVYIETKQTSTAIKVLVDATQCDPSNWQAWYQLGNAHMRQKEWSHALSAFERARKECGYRADLYIAMATCYLKQNRKTEALQLVKDVLQCDPQHSEALRLQKQL
jgi:serine/threonine protein kinase/tetratricopeptide (TPR) repeat protein